MHLAAAREWRFGPGMISNFEHPVLMKVIAGLGLDREKPDRGIDETHAGRALFPVLFALLVFVAGAWTRARSGTAAGIGVAALLAAEPTLRGHASLVQSDMLVTLFLVASAAVLDVACGRSTHERRLLIASGALYGFAMASKYSAAPFLAVFVLVALLRIRGNPDIFLEGKRERTGGSSDVRRDARAPAAEGSHLGRRRVVRGGLGSPSSLLSKLGSYAVTALCILLPAFVTLSLVQIVSFSSTSPEAFRAGLDAEFRGLPQEAAVHGLADTLPKWAAGYGAGLLFVQGVAGPGERFNYFFGEVSGKGAPLYFPVALAIKLTTAAVVALLAALAGTAITLLRKGARCRRRLFFLFAGRSFVPFSLGAAYLLAAAASDVNIGVRHALPVAPFALVAAAGAGRTLFRRKPRAFRIVLLCLVAFAGLEAAARFGHEISFGNLFVGGPPGVPPILSDSNVDWSQEQGQVFDRVRRGDLGRVGIVTLVLDEREASAAGVGAWVDRPDVPIDTVFLSRHLWDLARAIEKSPETWPKFTWLRGWLPPLAHGIEKRARSVEPFGDAYLMFRLNPTTGAP